MSNLILLVIVIAIVIVLIIAFYWFGGAKKVKSWYHNSRLQSIISAIEGNPVQ